jgi:hypothetical protein
MTLTSDSTADSQKLTRCLDYECLGRARGNQFPTYFTFCPDCGTYALDTLIGRSANKLWLNLFLFGSVFSLLIIEPVWPAYFLALYVYLHAIVFILHPQRKQRSHLLIYLLAALIVANFGTTTLGALELWFAIATAFSFIVLLRALFGSHGPRLGLALAFTLMGFLEAEWFFVSHLKKSGLANVAHLIYVPLSASIDLKLVIGLVNWWVFRLVLVLAAGIGLRNSYGEMANCKIGRIINGPSPFRPVRLIEWNPAIYLQNFRNNFARSIVAFVVLPVYYIAKSTLIFMNYAKRTAHFCWAMFLKALDFTIRSLLWTLFMLKLFAVGTISAILQAIFDWARAMSISVVTVLFPLALSVALTASLLGLSLSISRVLASNQYAHLWSSFCLALSIALSLLIVGRWAIQPILRIHTWWRIPFQDTSPLGFFTSESAGTLRLAANGAANYLQVIVPKLFLCFFINLLSFDLLGSFLHKGPYRFGIPFVVCLLLIAVCVLFASIVKLFGRTGSSQ